MALNTSAEAPVPVGEVSRLIGGWIDRLGAVWVEGQITQLSRRPGAGVVFLTLRDPSHDISVSVTCFREVFDGVKDVVGEGARVVVHAKPEWYAPRGQLSLRAAEIRPVGVGELLARLEQLKKSLAAEGLFAAERKRPLPFLPQPDRAGLRAGLGRRAGRAGERPAALARRPLRGAATWRCRACTRCRRSSRRSRSWTRSTSVDVIIVARGGGSVEDLLPFSDEQLVRAVAGVPYAGRLGDRARAGHPAARPRRRPARRHADATRRRRSCRTSARSTSGCGSCATAPTAVDQRVPGPGGARARRTS